MKPDAEKRDAAISLLGHPQSKKRESGAKQLRKLASPAAGKALLSALRKEVLDSRTWSTQYHMILALGFCKYRPALDFLWELAGQSTDHTTLYQGLGDAIVRIDVESINDFSTVFDIIATKRYELIDGAFQAMAILQMIPTKSEIARIIKTAELPEAVEFVRGHPTDVCGLRNWVVVAAANWPHDAVHDFLERCRTLGDPNLQDAAEHSLNGKYIKHSPY